MTTIDSNNYEVWLLRYAEGELDTAERKSVEAWLASHPDAADELTLYLEAPRLQRDDSVSFAAPLRHSRPLWPVVLRWSAAAAVLAAVLLPLTVRRPSHNAVPEAVVALAPELPSPADPASEPVAVATPPAVRHRTPAPKAEPIAPPSDTAVSPSADLLASAPAPSDTLPPVVASPSPAPVYVDDLIVVEDDCPPAENSLAAVYIEQTNDGINVSRLIGSFLKSNIKQQ